MRLGWLTRQILGDEQYGALQYQRSPADGRAWGGPMNGQAWRCKLVAELILEAEPVALVETGTYRGTTTEWLSAFQLPIYTCEASPENYGFSRARLKVIPNVNLMHLDSRAALRKLLGGPLFQELNKPILFYLDAHWNEELPLADEMEIIFSACRRAVVLVDDFQVPDDPGYGFDDYGPGKALTLDYIAEKVRGHGLAMFYPRKASQEETGAKRGCIVLADSHRMGSILDGVCLLRRLT